MALIFCPECGSQVSEHAKQCIKCSYPIDKLTNKYNSSFSSHKEAADKIKQHPLYIAIVIIICIIAMYYGIKSGSQH